MKKYYIEFEYQYIAVISGECKTVKRWFIVELHYSNVDDDQIKAICKNRMPAKSTFIHVTQINPL
jgi:hypothetical protein